MKPLIRFAKKDDAAAILRLIQGLADFEKASEQVTITVDDLLRDGFGTVPKFWCFVAEIQVEAATQIVGMALFYNRYSTWKGPTIHLEDLMVQEEFRGQGVGTALYRAVLSFAKERKVRRVNWEVLDWNTPAIEFYEKSGADVLKQWHVVSMDDKALESYLES
ncbi:MAG TPA: GNAT family N-acetyltransferase [Flavobacteriaceae bacterium]|nr:GNAT family N-acetyltransferase [Flavobacteriaceae bacterium]